jgi:RNA polymerase sigma-70 factor (ECF subfamily)
MTKPSGSNEFVDRLRSGDMEAFEALYVEYRPRLAKFVSNLVAQPETVEEVINDTMVAIWKGVDRFQGSSKLSTWIFSIAYRIAIRARGRQDLPVSDDKLIYEESQLDNPDVEVERRKLQDLLRNAFEQLSPEHRSVVDLTYFHEMHYREIAVIMDCPVDTVKTRMFHARKKLKGLLGGSLPDWL